MKIFHGKNGDDPGEQIFKLIEEEVGEKIFTMRIIEQTDDGLHVVVAFEDKSVLMGLIRAQFIDGKIAAQISGNFI